MHINQLVSVTLAIFETMVLYRQPTFTIVLLGASIFSAVSVEHMKDDYNEYLKKIRMVPGLITNERLAAMYVEEMSSNLSILINAAVTAYWNYENNITDYYQELAEFVSLEVTKKQREIALTAKRFDYKSLKNVTLKRLLRTLSEIGLGNLDDDQIIKAENLSSKMIAIYSTTLVSVGSKHNLSLNPDLEDILAMSRNYSELLKTWSAWHDEVGPNVKDLFVEYVKLANISASRSGYSSLKEEWLVYYEVDNFTDVVDELWEQVFPLYQKLHAYVRKHLKQMYPEQMPEDGTIPAHLLGNMWAQTWSNLYHDIGGGSPLDVTEELNKQNWTASRMWKAAEDFFVSMGLPSMTDTFWNKSVMTKPNDRKIVCHASAWDFFETDDFRIKMCTTPTKEQLEVIHHEMGHVIYFMLYSHQHSLFRYGANPGFHEAVGDLIGISSSTPSHLRLLKLLGNETVDSIDALLLKALDKIAFLPFGYLLDKWRWSVFTGETPFNEMNKKFWEYRIKYQGVSPPVNRSERYFDAGAKFHVAGNTPYIRYFVAFILQFQFHEYLCTEACLYTDEMPLNKCNLYQQVVAGDILREGLSLGSSKPWPEVLQIMTGVSGLSASSLLKYFEPLENWLDCELENETFGWKDADVDTYFETDR